MSQTRGVCLTYMYIHVDFLSHILIQYVFCHMAATVTPCVIHMTSDDPPCMYLLLWSHVASSLKTLSRGTHVHWLQWALWLCVGSCWQTGRQWNWLQPGSQAGTWHAEIENKRRKKRKTIKKKTWTHRERHTFLNSVGSMQVAHCLFTTLHVTSIASLTVPPLGSIQ